MMEDYSGIDDRVGRSWNALAVLSFVSGFVVLLAIAAVIALVAVMSFRFGLID